MNIEYVRNAITRALGLRASLNDLRGRQIVIWPERDTLVLAGIESISVENLSHLTLGLSPTYVRLVYKKWEASPGEVARAEQRAGGRELEVTHGKFSHYLLNGLVYDFKTEKWSLTASTISTGPLARRLIAHLGGDQDDDLFEKVFEGFQIEIKDVEVELV